MRGCLFVLALAAVVLGGLAWFVPPLAANTILTAVVGQRLEGAAVEVETSFPPDLLLLHADAVRVTGQDVRSTDGSFAAADLDLRFSDVDLGSLRAAEVTATVTDATLAGSSGTLAVPVRRIDIAGDPASADATLHFERADVARLVAAAAGVAGATAEVDLVAPASVRIRAGSIDGTARLAVEGGSLVGNLPGLPPLVLVPAVATGPFALHEVRIAAGELELDGTLDLGILLR
jgi:hypothetical protein